MNERSLGDHALSRLRSQLAAPALVAERYELREPLGRGGMGEVHRAYDRHLEREVAIKLLATELASPEVAARLHRESRVLARLEHPGIVPVYDAGVLDDGRVYYVMRLVDGVRLDVYARDARTRGITRGDLLRTVLRIAEAVGFAHERGVVHRDLKPSNVMIGPFGEVLVLDWGVATTLGARGSAAGTPGFIAPEAARGDAPVDVRADVYSLGVLLGELLAAHEEPVGRPLASLVASATAADPAARYSSMAALAADLRRWLDGEPVSAHRESLSERVGRFVHRHQVAILLLLGYAIVRSFIFVRRGL
ncbi:MAG: serine/threonine-protein kinase [Gemmatimonadaceae bacterium]